MAGGLTCAGVLVAAMAAMGPSPEAPGAEPSPVALSWSVPPGCPTASEVTAEIERFLTASAALPPGMQVAVDARITQEREGYWSLDLRIELADSTIARSIEAEDCSVLASAAALVTSVVLDPAAVLQKFEEAEAREPDSPPEPPAPPPPPTPTPPSVEITAPAPAPHRFAGGMRLSGLGGLGALPGFGFGIAGAAGVDMKRGRVELTASYLFPRAAYADEDERAGASLQLWSLGARGCYVPRLDRVSFPLCGGPELGAMRADGIGLAETRRARGLWTAAFVGASVTYHPAEPLGLWLGTEGYLAITRPGFRVDDVGRVHKAPAGGFRVHAGLELRFDQTIPRGRGQ